MSEIEREFKWAVEKEEDFDTFASVLKSVLEAPATEKMLYIHDAYLEKPDGALSAEKVALRIRETDGKFEATLKTRTRLINGLACRKELTLPLPLAENFEQALQLLKQRQEWEGVALADLQVKFEIKNCRKLYEFSYKAARCEAALDRYVIEAEGKTLACREIELEFKEGVEKDFEELVLLLSQKSGLLPARISKVATAEKMLCR